VQLWERLYSRDQRDVIPESVADGYPESRKARIRLDTGSQLRFVRYDEKRGVSALSHY
jgi:hypothetical protein